MFESKRKLSDFTEEIEAHLQLEMERLRGAGMSEEDARTEARRAFGNVTRARERFYEAGRWVWWDLLWQDVRFGLRMMVRSPAVTIVAVLTLALGIGATTAIFSAVYMVLLKRLPFKDSARLVFIQQRNPSRGFDNNTISPPEILAWRDSGAFDDLGAYSQRSCVLTGVGAAEQDACEIASSNLFPLLGASALRGRLFLPHEDHEGAPRVTILSYGFWQRHYGGDEKAIGSAIQLNGESYTIVGVMPASFSHQYASPYGHNPEMWLAGIALSPAHLWNDYFGVGRLKHGISLDQAEKRMDQVSVRLEQAYPDLKGWRAQMVSLRAKLSGDSRSALVLLMGAVVFVLLIACANVANLLLARGAGRAREFGVRNALGASQRRIVRQLLTESLVISLAGGVLGVLLAFWGCKGLAALAPQYLLQAAPGLARGALDLRVLAFALVTVLGTTVLFGLAPALQSARVNVTDKLKETSQSSLLGPRSRRFRNTLVVTEIALAMVLMVGAGLMVRTLVNLDRVNLGFSPENVLGLHVSLSGPRYDQPQARVQFWVDVVAAVKALPGVEAASVSRGLPVGDWAGQSFTISEQPNPPAGEVPSADYVIAGPDYFDTLKIPVLRGRSFTQHDTQQAESVAIVNEELARVYWPGQDSLGKRLRVGSPSAPWRSVVAVTANVLSDGPDAVPTPRIYIPYEQFPWLLDGPQNLLVRTSSTVDPQSLVRAVVQQIHGVDKNQPVTDLAALDQVTSELVAQHRMVTALLSAFAVLALVLSGLGIYSVHSYSIAQRTREIGVRMALGAGHGSVLRLVIGGSLRVAVLGIAIGTASALTLTHLMAHLLFGVGAMDAATICAVALILVATSLLASYLPARRAMKVDPITALRYE
jgi:predicted permease